MRWFCYTPLRRWVVWEKDSRALPSVHEDLLRFCGRAVLGCSSQPTTAFSTLPMPCASCTDSSKHSVPCASSLGLGSDTVRAASAASPRGSHAIAAQPLEISMRKCGVRYSSHAERTGYKEFGAIPGIATQDHGASVRGALQSALSGMRPKASFDTATNELRIVTSLPFKCIPRKRAGAAWSTLSDNFPYSMKEPAHMSQLLRNTPHTNGQSAEVKLTERLGRNRRNRAH